MNHLYTSRIEIKTIITKENYTLLQKYIDTEFVLLQKEQQYCIKTIYLCKWKHDNQKGKIRIRIYNDKEIFIEEKKKINNKSFKQRYMLSLEEFEKYNSIYTLNDLYLLNCELGFTFDNQYLNYGSFQKLQVSYDRKVKQIICNAEPLRITFDYNLFLTGCDIPDFQAVPLLQQELLIMELKGKDVNSYADILEKQFGIFMKPLSKFKLASCY